MRLPTRRRSRAGFTILEILLAAGVLTIVGLTVSQGLIVANDSHEAVTRGTARNGSMREASAVLRSELKASRESLITLTKADTGQAVLTFQVPIDAGGTDDWGAYDRRLGNASTDWNRSGWSLRYQVQDDQQGTPALVRQVLDLSGSVQFEETLVTGLRGGDHPDGAGFEVDQTGDVWLITISHQEQSGNSKRSETIHVRTRN